jgi:hypothetical protein
MYLKIVDALAPLVGQQRRGLRVAGLDPRREQTSLVSLVPEESVCRKSLSKHKIVLEQQKFIRLNTGTLAAVKLQKTNLRDH